MFIWKGMLQVHSVSSRGGHTVVRVKQGVESWSPLKTSAGKAIQTLGVRVFVEAPAVRGLSRLPYINCSRRA